MQDSKAQTKIVPVSTMAQGQGFLLAQATPPTQAEDWASGKSEDASLAEKGQKRYVNHHGSIRLRLAVLTDDN
jgi:hypothetical protein